MSTNGIDLAVNTNPMVFEELATSLATLATYTRDDMATPFHDMEHLYRRALQGPPSYSEITSLTGHNLSGRDRQTGRAAWLMMNIEGLDIFAVHSHIWHHVGGKFSAPILKQLSHALGVESKLNFNQMQKLGSKLDMIDVLGIKDGVIWLVEVVTNKKVAESVLSRTSKNDLFRSNVFKEPVVKEKNLDALTIAKKQIASAFPSVEVATLVLIQHPTGPDFELYQIDLTKRRSKKEITLKAGAVRKNSIDYADQIGDDREIPILLGQVYNPR